MSAAGLTLWKARTKITGDAGVNGLSPCARQVGKRLFEASGADIQLDRPSIVKLCERLLKRRRKHTHKQAIQSQGPPVAPTQLPSSTFHLFHSSQLSIKINSLIFRGLASIYLGREDTHRFVAVPESPCSTFLISEQSNQTR